MFSTSVRSGVKTTLCQQNLGLLDSDALALLITCVSCPNWSKNSEGDSWEIFISIDFVGDLFEQELIDATTLGLLKRSKYKYYYKGMVHEVLSFNFYLPEDCLKP